MDLTKIHTLLEGLLKKAPLVYNGLSQEWFKDYLKNYYPNNRFIVAPEHIMKTGLANGGESSEVIFQEDDNLYMGDLRLRLIQASPSSTLNDLDVVLDCLIKDDLSYQDVFYTVGTKIETGIGSNGVIFLDVKNVMFNQITLRNLNSLFSMVTYTMTFTGFIAFTNK